LVEREDLDEHLAPVHLITHAAHEPGALQPVDDPGDRTGRQARELRNPPRGQRSFGARSQIQRLVVGARQAHLPGDPGVPPPRDVDALGQLATDLRVSLTYRCHLRCTYRMPAEGLPWLRGEDVLTDAELLRLLRVAVGRLGVTDIRLTGGEPLLRPGLEDLV